MNTDSPASIDLQTQNGIALLTINQPAARNAMTPQMLDDLAELTQQCSEDDSIACVLVTGSGDQAFCAGGDISGVVGSGDNTASPSERELVSMLERWSQSVVHLHTMPKPSIAVLNGVAAGAGMGLALSCDLRIASPNASFVTAFARLAMSGDFGGSYFLTQLVGPAKARELYFLSERVNAEDAQALGIINRIIAADQLQSEAMALASRLAQAPAPMYKAMKANLNASLNEDVQAVVKQEAKTMIECALSEATQKATAAFFNR